MNAQLFLGIFLAAWAVLSSGPWAVRAVGQVLERGGVTAQGDALRGEAMFLRGMAWYDLGAAQAGALNQQALEEWNRSVQEGYRQFLQDRAARAASRRAAVKSLSEKTARELAATQRRWRENPTLEDIRSGLALNALVSDLADPTIPLETWREATVELPKSFSIAAPAYSLASGARRRRPLELVPSVVAIGRMKVEGGWPVSLRRPELTRERDAYKRAVQAAIARCARGQKLLAADVDRVRDALDELRQRVPQAVPAPELARQARAFLDELDQATRLFLDQDFAEELVRDVETHRAKSVGELLAFMKKYRLLFADSGDDPALWSVYEQLHQALRSQKVALEIAGGGPKGGSDDPDPAAAPPDRKR